MPVAHRKLHRHFRHFQSGIQFYFMRGFVPVRRGTFISAKCPKPFPPVRAPLRGDFAAKPNWMAPELAECIRSLSEGLTQPSPKKSNVVPQQNRPKARERFKKIFWPRTLRAWRRKPFQNSILMHDTIVHCKRGIQTGRSKRLPSRSKALFRTLRNKFYVRHNQILPICNYQVLIVHLRASKG